MHSIKNETKNKIYQNISLESIFELVMQNPKDDYYKLIKTKFIKINNDFILKTKFICHRINTIEELKNIPEIFGVEIDIRDCNKTNKLILSHDPYKNGEFLDEFLKYYKHQTIILNIKSERTEVRCLDLLKNSIISDYFFLDSSIPMMFLLNSNYSNNNFACRHSEYEPIECYLKIKQFVSWIWVDCFTKLNITFNDYQTYKNDSKKICIVSPELQGQQEKIQIYRQLLIDENVIPDAICCKYHNIIEWI